MTTFKEMKQLEQLDKDVPELQKLLWTVLEHLKIDGLDLDAVSFKPKPEQPKAPMTPKRVDPKRKKITFTNNDGHLVEAIVENKRGKDTIIKQKIVKRKNDIKEPVKLISDKEVKTESLSDENKVKKGKING